VLCRAALKPGVRAPKNADQICNTGVNSTKLDLPRIEEGKNKNKTTSGFLVFCTSVKVQYNARAPPCQAGREKGAECIGY
jgi:hypothetical protein